MNEANPNFRPDSRSSPMLIVVALVLGGITVILTNVYIHMARQDIEGRPKVVYRFNRPLDRGEKLNIDRDLTAIKISDKFTDSLKAMGILVYDPDQKATDQQGQPVNRTVNQGEFLTSALLTGEGKTVDYKVLMGKRGTPLQINSRNAPGLLQPGMFVDLSANFTEPGQKVAKELLVMEHVKVIAVGSVTEPTANRHISYNTITVETEPEEGLQLLTIAKYVGKDGFDISIRNHADDQYSPGIRENVLKLVGLK